MRRVIVVRISVRVSHEMYKALKSLVEAGLYPSVSDIIREAVLALLREENSRNLGLMRRREIAKPAP
ncbi:MAG: hypothetical protein DRK00_00895 [Thermoprotei archaeon]|nr:MAG: hypothetical protein DRK00_00895 [Thermoprotei archaeon]